MAAGLQTDVFTLNQTCGNAVKALVQALNQCSGINDMLTNGERPFSTADLLAAGMDQADITTLQQSFAALALFAQVGFGQIAQSGAEPSNFFFQAQQLLGTTPL